jgi:hypothetical protein
VGAGHIERVKKRKRKPVALSADSVWFWFTCPPHYTKLKPARGRLEEATYNATRPPNRQTKLDFVLSHTACRSNRRQRTWCWKREDVTWERGVETKNYIKEAGKNREQEMTKGERSLKVVRTSPLINIIARTVHFCYD